MIDASQIRNTALPKLLRAIATGKNAKFHGHDLLLNAAADELEQLRSLVVTMLENEPDDSISDAGHVVLDLWRHEARQVLGIVQPTNVRLDS